MNRAILAPVVSRTFSVMAFAVMTLSGCAEASQSGGMALDQANSVIKSGRGKLWVEPGQEQAAAPNGSAAARNTEEEQKQRVPTY